MFELRALPRLPYVVERKVLRLGWPCRVKGLSSFKVFGFQACRARRIDFCSQLWELGGAQLHGDTLVLQQALLLVLNA